MYVVSYYNTSMKVAFIVATIYSIYLIKYHKHYSMVYDPLADDFPHWKYCVPAALILTLIFHTAFSPFEFSWSFSIWLEAISILP